MKKILTLLALATGLAVLTPTASEARDYRHGHAFSSFSHRCGSCNTAMSRERVLIGRDRCGQPVYSWRTMTHQCRPVKSFGRHHSHRGHQHHHYHHHKRHGFRR